ncbi:uncharacterized protein VICG_00467 [Vittaforma corneae ATCC 50505]|uniref:RING-type domain-containing protein n=1 Tax=Vittaforma corneae (strain ATCC 50505) TaxID=993615 RepID=L2GP12_VITCO|nr:uncharacterized protein VICG_00467 [Vittaforma corneae ATCC 50505]ELA42369.1 hypothetical protein VICG_00467 [Vittaforma corneae ATCC 50505]
MAELACPVCKGDTYLNPNIKIYTSPCFHRICESCLYKIFQQGYAPCPECGTLLRRINFITSTFEDIEIERELKMRKLMNRHFMREECEFNSEVEYNNYLEEYENVLFELLEYKNENMAKEKINQIKNTSCILVPIGTAKNTVQDHSVAKKLKVVESWYVYRPEVQERFITDESVSIPKDFITPFSPAGLKKSEILDFIVYSLAEIDK